MNRYSTDPGLPGLREVLAERLTATLRSADELGADDLVITAGGNHAFALALTTLVDAEDWLDRKMAAMAAHVTQISLEGGFFALSNKVGSKALGREHYRLVKKLLAQACLPNT